ncbi:hypothetical protein L1049_017864 [Liquidambar formosana]|uniref:DYW domain-containing protein n=1 Tax=Liquidambar formosana TaxID=63359 RepID=A0AAP0R7I6_LIQFO
MNHSSFLLMSERQRFANLLRNCAKNSLFDQGQQVHAAVVKMGLGSDLMINNDLIDMYRKCSRMDMACAVFDRMLERNVVSWTALMCGYLQKGDAETSLSLFRQMGSSSVRANEFTFSINLKACGILGIAENGVQIHVMCVKTGFEGFPVVGNSVIDMYSRCGRISDAAQMFNIMPSRNLISWNVMIAGYTHEGNGEKSLLLLQKMQEEREVPDEFTCTSTLKACSGLGAIREGSQIHASLITKGFPFSVQTIVAGYAQEGNLPEAMDLLRQLRESSTQIDGFVLSSMMGVFADLALVEQGKQMHCYAIKIPSGLDISVSNSIVDMYLKCGLTEEAERLFSEMPERNVVSWTVMITGYGKHGLGEEAIRLFNKMQLDNIKPDGHVAILDSLKKVKSTSQDCVRTSLIKPKVEHYACMVDLLGRAGRLNEAKDLIKNMPLKPNVGILQTLLSACRVHQELEIGREIGEILLKLDGDSPVNYVMMSNIYAEAGNWKESERVRELVKMKGLKKEAGNSWVEIDKEVHFFFGGDDTHPLTERILEVLKELERRMKQELGYAYGVRFALHDVEEESKEESLRVHSEKLAIGLALVCDGLEEGKKVIRVFKNLRVCGDCHEFIKGLSKVLKKVFVVRDANRFHKFENGFCSCRDYW